MASKHTPTRPHAMHPPVSSALESQTPTTARSTSTRMQDNIEVDKESLENGRLAKTLLPKGATAPGSLDSKSGLLHVIIHTPRESGKNDEYKCEAVRRIYRASRILPVGIQCFYGFGSVPGTRARNGAPLDALVLMGAPAFAGCLISTRLIGGFRAQQRDGGRILRDNGLIAVAETQVSPAPPTRPIHALSDTQVREIEDSIYFHNHTQGRRLQVMSLVTAAAAERLLSKSMEAYASRGER
jgi:inorganic pyrophosphatase